MSKNFDSRKVIPIAPVRPGKDELSELLLEEKAAKVYPRSVSDV
jgi:hypothetical protein